ncbi:PRC-barrel domain-containing protein [Ruegeria sp. HKCCD8929]|uniref:PRC-barrel domain-containing protein n=1 Tax=Ruegeria sp. HKCCD8929 TaxID=2683006 RepID=UPI0014888F55|nr:PRC-barrel domain-containing protein [Ruegeria sp. HKCCD8929]
MLRIAATVWVIGAVASPGLAESTAPVAGETVLGVEVNVTRIVSKGYSANALIGADVRNERAETVGSVHDLIVGVEGEVSLAIIEVGGFLGLGSKWVAVPAHLFEADGNNAVVLAGATEAALGAMPPFTYAQ